MALLDTTWVKLFYVTMESDLNPRSTANVIFKYADDTDLLVPAYSDLSVEEEVVHILSSGLTQIKWSLTGQKPTLYFDAQVLITVSPLQPWTTSSGLLRHTSW